MAYSLICVNRLKNLNKLKENKMEKLFKIGDIVKINEDGIFDSADYEFMCMYIDQTLVIVEEHFVSDVWQYICKDEKGDVIMFNAYNKNPNPFPFIDADLTKLALVATSPEIGKKVFIGCDFNASKKQHDFVDKNHGMAFEILEVGNDTSKLDGVPFKVKHSNIYEAQEFQEIIAKPVKTTTVEDLIKTHILDEIFSDYPEKENAYDFFMKAKVDGAGDVISSTLNDLGFEVCSEYEYENIRSIRGLMHSMFNDLIKLCKKVVDLKNLNKFQVFVICNNSLERLNQNLSEKDAKQLYLKYANEWYRFDGTFTSVEEVENYENSERFLDDGNEANVTWEAM
jgi:hypothetical protein